MTARLISTPWPASSSSSRARPTRRPGWGNGSPTPDSPSTSGTSGAATRCRTPSRATTGCCPRWAPVGDGRRGHEPRADRRPRPAAPGHRRRRPHPRRLPRRPAARRRRGRDRAAWGGRPGGGRDPGRQARRRLRRSGVRPAAADPRRHPVAPRRDRHPAARCDAAGQQRALRPPGLPGGRGGVRDPVPHRDDAGDRARLGGRRSARCRGRHRSTPRRSASGPTPCTTTSPGRGRRSPRRFADLVRAHAPQAA